MAAPATPVSLNGTADTTLKATTAAVYHLAVSETAGAVASFKLRSGSGSGQIVIPVRLAALQTVIVPLTDGILFTGGVYEDWVSGAYEGTVNIGPA